MIDKGNILFGSGCLAIGLAGGYFLSQRSTSASSPPVSNQVPTTKSARHAGERTEARMNSEARKFQQSIPRSDSYSERNQWLENLEAGKIGALIDALCTDVGPDGLKYQDKSFLDAALKKWWIMPSDVLYSWAKADPQAATEWFLSMAENGRGVAFQDWADIAKAVSCSSGPLAYHEWAAGIIAQATKKQRAAIFGETSDQDAMGIAASIQDVGLRDTVLAAAARRNSGTVGQTEQTIHFLSQISTPEARLQAITNDQGQYAYWIQTYTIPASGWQKLGFTREQFDAALDKVQR